ncbi:MAG: molybdate ABC transporter permease subunit [Thalassolituus sp.]
MSFSNDDINTILLTLKLAACVTVILLLISTPLALWLARTENRFAGVINTLVAMPLILPPSVIGFYMLIAMGPDGFIGEITQALGLGLLPFTFSGLVVASVIYSLPFVVQPIQNALQAAGTRPQEVAATLGAGPIDTFFRITLPLARPGFFTAAILGFTHTIGEFGVVLMIGGNIPDETRLISVQIYDHVEALNYEQAHSLSLLMVIFSFTTLLLLYSLRSGRVGYKVMS